MVRNGLSPFLKTFGFRRRGNSFARPFTNGFDVLGVQKSPWGSKSSTSFTVHIGICWPRAQELLGRSVDRMPFSVSHCTVFRCIGHIMPEHQDFWWKVRADSSTDAIQLDLLERVERYVTPWFEWGHDIAHTLQLAQEYKLIKFIAALEKVRDELGQPKHPAGGNHPLRNKPNSTPGGGWLAPLTFALKNKVKLEHLILGLVLLLSGCNRTTPVVYEPHINTDAGKSTFWQYVPPDKVAALTVRQLRKHYETQTNYFTGSIVVHRFEGDTHAICFSKSLLCNKAENTYLIAEGIRLTNAITKSSFEEILEEIYRTLKNEASNK